MWERIQKTSHLKQLPTHFEAKREKGMGTPFPRVPAPLHPCTSHNNGKALERCTKTNVQVSCAWHFGEKTK